MNCRTLLNPWIVLFAVAAPAIVLAEVQTVGRLIADRQDGAFRIEVGSLGIE